MRGYRRNPQGGSVDDNAIFSGPLSESEACSLESGKIANGVRSIPPNRPGKRHPQGRGAHTVGKLASKPAFRWFVAACLSYFHGRQWRKNIRSGEDAQFVYKLLTGSVRVCKMLSDGQRHISCFHVPGDVFGLERTATHRTGAEAIEDSQVFMFRRSHVERLIATDLDAAHQMLGIFISKLDDAEAQMFRLGRQSALQRVAAFLVEIEGRLGRRGPLNLPMTRRDMGDYLGLSIETVSRSISRLERRHALDRVEPRRMHLDQAKIDGMVEH